MSFVIVNKKKTMQIFQIQQFSLLKSKRNIARSQSFLNCKFKTLSVETLGSNREIQMLFISSDLFKWLSQVEK